MYDERFKIMSKKTEMRTKVKVCGLTTLEDARFASGALADFLGFIFYEKSPRYIEPAKAGAIINWIEGPEMVGVFVNQPLDDVNSIARQTGIDLVQLHGNESPEYCELVEKPVIKAFHITDKSSTKTLRESVEAYMSSVEYFLFDSKTEKKWGGTGKTFNWDIIQDISNEKAYFLSGGLNSENVHSAISSVSPAVVDLSSGLESSPGIKDFDKIEEFFEQMRIIWKTQEMNEL